MTSQSERLRIKIPTSGLSLVGIKGGHNYRSGRQNQGEKKQKSALPPKGRALKTESASRLLVRAGGPASGGRIGGGWFRGHIPGIRATDQKGRNSSDQKQ